MVALQILIVGFLHLFIVESAPAIAVNEGLSANILITDKNSNSHDPLPLREVSRSLERRSITIPLMESRFPILEDNRQNWGLLINESNTEENDNTDYNRPINIPRPPRSNSLKVTKDTLVKQSLENSVGSTKKNLQKQVFLEQLASAGNTAYADQEKACDIAIITCCINDLDFNSCLSASQCLNLKEDQSVCEKNIVLKALTRVQTVFR